MKIVGNVKKKKIGTALVLKKLPHCLPDIYVVVQFHPWFKFYFPLFSSMVIYDIMKRKGKENKT